jgi:hypothetical protein
MDERTSPAWEDPHVCQTCHRRLTWHETTVGGHDAGGRWEHGVAADHEPQPVREADSDTPTEILCDFCSSPDPIWVYRAARQTMVIENDRHRYEASDDGGWLACAGCAGFIDRLDTPGLVNRVAKAMAGKHPEFATDSERRLLKRMLTEQYDSLLRTVQRAPR